MAKTGTTALQHTLRHSAESLERRRVLYPTPLGDEQCHVVLVHGMRRPDNMPRLEARRRRPLEARSQFLRQVANEIEHARPQTLVLSTERLGRPLREGALHTFQIDLQALGATRIDVVAYLRAPASNYLSRLQQVLKHSSRVPPPEPPAYRAALEPYLQVFGEGFVHAHLFDSDALRNGDIVDDFVHRHLATSGVSAADLTSAGRINKMLSAPSIEMMLSYRLSVHPVADDVMMPDSNWLRSRLVELDATLGLSRPVLHPEVADWINHASPDLEWVQQHFDLVFPQVDYGRIGTGRIPETNPWPTPALHEIVRIDPEERHRLGQALVREAFPRLPWRRWPDVIRGRSCTPREWRRRLSREWNGAA
jgi:hypothetical protein